MLFSEPVFFVFFSGYFLLHLIIPAKWRLYLIIVGSTVFYTWWRLDYAWVPFILTLIAWTGALWTEKGDDRSSRKRRLAVTIVVLFAPLAIIKYSGFLYNSVLSEIPGLGAVLPEDMIPQLGLPLGISFVTFTLTAYLVDVYRGRFPVEKRLDQMFGYVLFFPHLIAGPILRPHELLPQLAKVRKALDAKLLLGVAIFTLGLVKKTIFADTIASIVDPVYVTGSQANAFEYVAAIYGFSLQIYCDFSGYTDMAIGLALMLGIRLPTNFLRPYTSTSIVEFWRRWHITLSHWLRDYLYIPLGGSRNGENRRLFNLMTTMILGGLWHGAAWTFVIWGFLHGAALVVVHSFQSLAKSSSLRIPRWLAIFMTFHFVTLAWIFFRAPDVEMALTVLMGPFVAPLPVLGDYLRTYLFELVLIAVFFATHRYDKHARIRLAVRKYNPLTILPVVAVCWVLVITLSQGSSGKFIYFDF